MNLSYVPIADSSSAPFGSSLHLTNTEIRVGPFEGYGYVLAKGNGSINSVSLRSSEATWLCFPVKNDLQIEGNVNIEGTVLVRNSTLLGLKGNYVVYSVPASSIYLLNLNGISYSPHTTISGTNFYIVPQTTDKFSLNLSEVYLLQSLYYVLLTYLLCVGIWSSWRKVHRKNLQHSLSSNQKMWIF